MLSWKARRYRPRPPINQRDVSIFGILVVSSAYPVRQSLTMTSRPDARMAPEFDISRKNLIVEEGPDGVRFVSKTSADTGCAGHRAGGRSAAIRAGQRFRG